MDTVGYVCTQTGSVFHLVQTRTRYDSLKTTDHHPLDEPFHFSAFAYDKIKNSQTTRR